MQRIGVLDAVSPVTGEGLFRVCDANREYEYSSTYAAVLVVPFRTTDADLRSIRDFRSKVRRRSARMSRDVVAHSSSCRTLADLCCHRGGTLVGGLTVACACA